jgi:hypothetical protein|tara:strand:+ start:289 stop:585 length:297 start_codon:yes stop_codon:yes gene_type:complete
MILIKHIKKGHVMSMTKKDFEAIAHCFTPFSEEGERGTGRAKPLRMIGSATSIVALLIPVFQEINPRFDMNAFLYACGFSDAEKEEIHEAMGTEEEVF